MAFADVQTSPLAPDSGLESGTPVAGGAVSPGNSYSRQLADHRRALAAQRDIERLSGLARSAPEAAFVSLMRNRRANAGPGSTPTSPTPPASATTAFEEAVTHALRRSRRLDFTQRRALQRHAAGLGLSRFDANLLIARVTHYHALAGQGGHRGEARPLPLFRRRSLWIGTGVTLLLVQGALGWVWYRLFM